MQKCGVGMVLMGQAPLLYPFAPFDWKCAPPAVNYWPGIPGKKKKKNTNAYLIGEITNGKNSNVYPQKKKKKKRELNTCVHTQSLNSLT
jgi:hypothetical protein